MRKTCREDGCSAEHYAKGLCHSHYRQGKRAEAMAARPVEGRRTCDVEGCAGFNYGNGLCRSHYYKARRAADAAVRPARVVPTCSREGCDAPTYGHGACQRHYYQHWRKPHFTMTADELRERYPSTSWDTRTWQLVLTVRGDVYDRLLDDMFRLS